MLRQILWFGVILARLNINCQGSIFYRQANGINNNDLIEINQNCTEILYVIVSNATDDEQTKIDQLSTQASSSEDVEALLDHVNWRMFISSQDEICDNFTYSTYQLQDACSNSTCSFSDSIDDLVFFPLTCGDRSCAMYYKSFVITKWPLFVVLGIICLIGNSVVIYDKIINLCKRQNKEKEIQIYHTLVLNLSLADLLMGIYLTAIAFEINQKVNLGVYFSDYGSCNGLEVINAVSSQVSISTLFIISVYRLNSVTKPYNRQHFKTVIVLIILTWVVWLLIAILPLLPFEPFKTTFTVGLTKNRHYEKDTFIEYPYFVYIFQEYALPTFINVTEVATLHTISNSISYGKVFHCDGLGEFRNGKLEFSRIIRLSIFMFIRYISFLWRLLSQRKLF